MRVLTPATRWIVVGSLLSCLVLAAILTVDLVSDDCGVTSSAAAQIVPGMDGREVNLRFPRARCRIHKLPGDAGTMAVYEGPGGSIAVCSDKNGSVTKSAYRKRTLYWRLVMLFVD